MHIKGLLKWVLARRRRDLDHDTLLDLEWRLWRICRCWIIARHGVMSDGMSRSEHEQHEDRTTARSGPAMTSNSCEIVVGIDSNDSCL